MNSPANHPGGNCLGAATVSACQLLSALNWGLVADPASLERLELRVRKRAHQVDPAGNLGGHLYETHFFCSSVPSEDAGSGEPQCARTGLPGQMGHASLALSQTVITKTNLTPANSSHDFLRAPEASIPYRSLRTQRARVLTVPDGFAPALYTSNRPIPFCRRRYSPMMLRAEFPVQSMRIFLG